VSSNFDEKRIFWFATVVDTDDPLMLNRVRVQFDTQNNVAILNSIPDNISGKKTKNASGTDLLPEFKWTEIDTFCFLPLLPIFLKTTPKKNETVNIFWPNPEYKYTEQYYIQGIFSSPLTMYNENFNSQRMFAAKNRLKSPQLLKNPTNGEYYISKTKGVFIEPTDVGLVGRGTCDIVIKENDVILRAGKSTTLPNNSNKEINANKTRSFIQLSNFNQREEALEPTETSRLEPNVQFVKTLLEWHVINPENQYDLFNYTINLYGLPEQSGNTTQRLKIDSVVPSSGKTLIYTVTFNNESMFDMSEKINLFIAQCNDGQINLPPNEIFNINNQFPLFFRPSPETFKIISSPSTGNDYFNMANLTKKIKYKTQKNGVGLISSRNTPGQQYNIVNDTQNQKSINIEKGITYNIQGADKLLFVSHESKIPSKQSINLDESTIYGISQSYLLDNVLPNTDPMVRGDQLMKFMNLVIKFLVSHVHAFPGLPPVPTAQDGTTVNTILQELQNASNTILNQNIRIN
jgi:hypothetical protein